MLANKQWTTCGGDGDDDDDAPYFSGSRKSFLFAATHFSPTAHNSNLWFCHAAWPMSLLLGFRNGLVPHSIAIRTQALVSPLRRLSRWISQRQTNTTEHIFSWCLCACGFEHGFVFRIFMLILFSLYLHAHCFSVGRHFFSPTQSVSTSTSNCCICWKCGSAFAGFFLGSFLIYAMVVSDVVAGKTKKKTKSAHKSLSIFSSFIFFWKFSCGE